jgi:hypothetical protein
MTLARFVANLGVAMLLAGMIAVMGAGLDKLGEMIESGSALASLAIVCLGGGLAIAMAAAWWDAGHGGPRGGAR